MTDHPFDSEASGLLIPLDGCHNFRSVSGWKTRGNRKLKPGRLFRSDGLGSLSAADQNELAWLDLSHVFDLRASGEISYAPSRWASPEKLRIWAGAESAAEADLTAMMKRGGLDAAAFHAAMCQVYARFPDDLADATRALGEVMLADNAGATLVHCTAGKDRTGFVVAMLLHAIGISAEDVMADYLLSNASFKTARVRFNTDGRLDAVESQAPGAIVALVGVHPEYLQAAEQRIVREYSSLGTWLETRAGLCPERRSSLAQRLLD